MRAKPQQSDLLTRYQQALTGLTPGGPEYADDPERAARFVIKLRNAQDTRIRKLTDEVRHWKEKCEKVEKLLQKMNVR